MPKTYDTQTQLKVLALFVRGDTYAQVSQATGIPIPTLNKIKTRNKVSLDLMKSRVVEHQASMSKKLLEKSQGIMERKLNRVEVSELIRDKAYQQLQDKVIDRDEFNRLTSGLSDLTITELNSVSKEAFNQSQIEQGKPTAISASPIQARDDLVRLVDELKKDHNEEELLKLVFDRELIEVSQNEPPPTD